MITTPPPARLRLIALALALALTWLALPLGHNPAAPSAPAILFLSPNTDEGLTLEESLKRLAMPDHARCRGLAQRILNDLEVGPGHVHDALGEWEGGIENSLLVILPLAPDAETLRCAAAWFGLVADQKAVLAFRPERRGPDILLMLEVPGTWLEVRQLLDAHGIRDRTILFDAGGCRVYVLDEGGQLRHAAQRLAKTTNGRLTSQRGRGESLAGATREEARERYREVLRGSRLALAAEAGR